MYGMELAPSKLTHYPELAEAGPRREVAGDLRERQGISKAASYYI
jgi:hypothetical protein